MNEICELIIYTASSALSFNVRVTTNDFQEKLSAALEEGTVILDTVEGSRLVLNAINVVAIEITSPEKEKSSKDTPPCQKF